MIQADSFTLTRSGESISVSSVVHTGSEVVLNIDTTVSGTGYTNYIKDSDVLTIDISNITDLAGNSLIALSNRSVTNINGSLGTTNYSEATTNKVESTKYSNGDSNNTITLTYDRPVNLTVNGGHFFS